LVCPGTPGSRRHRHKDQTGREELTVRRWWNLRLHSCQIPFPSSGIVFGLCPAQAQEEYMFHLVGFDIRTDAVVR
jgi:hypothetical protein